MSLNGIIGKFRKFFPDQWLNSFARQTGLVKRSSSKFGGADFFQLLIQAVNAPTELSLNSFCQKLYQINRNAKLKAQSLWERIVSQEAVSFIEGIYEKTWSLYTERLKKDCLKCSCNFFEQFSQILIEDSTVITLNEKLSPFFKGCGGTGSKSSLKIHLVFDAISNTFRWLKIYKNKEPDCSLAYDILKLVTEKTLVLRDLGFFILEVFNEIHLKGSFFISRLHPKVKVYLGANDSEPIDLIKYIKKNYKLYSSGSFNVFLGVEKRMPARLVFYKCPEDVVNERKRKIKRTRQRKGGTASYASG